MKLSEIVEAKEPFDLHAYVNQAIDDVFEFEEDNPHDEISLRGGGVKGDHFTLDVESRRSERDVRATIKIVGDEVEVEIFGETRKFKVNQAEEPVELGKDIVGWIGDRVEDKDGEEDEEYDEDEDY